MYLEDFSMEGIQAIFRIHTAHCMLSVIYKNLGRAECAGGPKFWVLKLLGNKFVEYQDIKIERQCVFKLFGKVSGHFDLVRLLL
jgi:hypothetical protein